MTTEDGKALRVEDLRERSGKGRVSGPRLISGSIARTGTRGSRHCLSGSISASLRRRLHVCWAVLAVLLVGCDPFVSKTISVNLKPTNGGSGAGPSTNDVQVQEVMKVIDATLVSNGFTRDTNSIAPEDQARGLIAFYGICTVTLSSNQVDIAFLQKYSSQFRAEAKKAIKQLDEKLRNGYGRENVKVEEE